MNSQETNLIEGVIFRQANQADAAAVLQLFDEAIEWFQTFGNGQQWGTDPWSTQDRQVARVREACELPGAWIAVHEQIGVCGALVLGEAMPYVPPADSTELYVRLLIASRHPLARGVGRALMSFAEAEARAAKVSQLRVDCYAGGSGSLVRFYESCGYELLLPFDEGDWPGQILIRHLID